MIKPVTYQGVFNFKSNLYALEVKSRFIDQSKANGYYTGYGNELAATVVDNQIQIGTGAFVIQGRMNEVESAELLPVTIENGKVGYVIARIETYHPSDEENCKFIIKTATSLDSIQLTQEDTYAKGAETSNKVYELPIYSFAMSGGNITSLTKLIKAVADYSTVKSIADNALTKAQAAVNTANTANTTANTANTKATNAVNTANTAKTTAETAEANSTTAKNTANEALQKIVKTIGTALYENGVLLHELDVDFIARACAIAFYAQEAELAQGYTKGGALDKRLKNIEKRLTNGGL